MTSFLQRRARALVAEAEVWISEGSYDEALRRLSAACDLLRRCRPPADELPALLRRVGALAASLGDEELSDRSYLEARRREVEREGR